MNKKNKIELLFAVIFVAANIVFFACSSEKQEKQVVASWNDVSITLSDFERVYFDSWQFKGMGDTPILRRNIARELIEKEIIVREAVKNNTIDESLYAQKLKHDYESILRRRYLEVTLKDTITPPTEKELKELLLKNNQSLKVRQLYSKSSTEIEKLNKRLKNGERFEDLEKYSYYDSSLVYTETNIGWVKWDQFDRNVEQAIFHLKENEISEPVNSLLGWHIFKVDSVRTTIQFNRDTDASTLVDLKHKTINRKLQVAGAKHIRELVWTKELTINARLFKSIWAYISPLLPETKEDKILKGYNELESSLPPAELGNQVIAKVDGESFTVNEFFYAIPDLPRNLLGPNLRWAIEGAIRNKIITETALDNGLASDPVVKEKYRRAKISYKYYAAVYAADSVLGRKVDLKKYYEKYKNNYVDFVESEIEQVVVKDRTQAVEIAKKIYNGDSFDKYENKNDKSVKSRLLVSSVDNPLGKKAADLSEGDIYAPIKTDLGYHIIRVLSQKKSYLKYEDIKNTLANQAQANYYELLHDGLLTSEYDARQIAYNDDVISSAFTDASKTIF